MSNYIASKYKVLYEFLKYKTNYDIEGEVAINGFSNCPYHYHTHLSVTSPFIKLPYSVIGNTTVFGAAFLGSSPSKGTNTLVVNRVQPIINREIRVKDGYIN